MRGKLKVTSCEVNMYRKIGYRKKNEDKNKFEIENVIVNSVYQVDVAPMNQRTYDFLLVIKDKDVYKFTITSPDKQLELEFESCNVVKEQS